MAKVKVRVTNAVVGGHTHGAVIEVDEKTANHLESIRYAVKVPKNTKLTEGDDSDDGDDNTDETNADGAGA